MSRRIYKNPFDEAVPITSSNSGNYLEWHEAASDKFSPTEVQLGDEGSGRILFWKLFLIFAFIIFWSRLAYLQAFQKDFYSNIAENNRTRSRTIFAQRGIIYDRSGAALVQNKPGFNLVAMPMDLPQSEIEEQARKLALVLGVDYQKIIEKIKNNKGRFDSVVIQSNLSVEQVLAFQAKQSELLGFEVATVPLRDYQDSQIFAHLLGYTGQVTEKELEEDKGFYSSQDTVGKSGLEKFYEKSLRGVNGKVEIEVDAVGRYKDGLGKFDSVQGNSLVLNIDKDLQAEAYKYFSTAKTKSKGAVVAMNPKNGQVLTLLSLPSFDNNLFSNGIDSKEFADLIQDTDLPLFNRAISGVYPPGSTVKPMVAAAALEEDVVKENTTIVDNGNLTIANQYNSDIIYNFYGWKRGGLGPVNVKSAIAKSSDIYFYVVTGGHYSYPNIKPLGIERLSNWYAKFGVGRKLGLDIEGEKAGVNASPKWKSEYFKDDPVLSRWYQGDTYHVGIGQGDMLVTPLHVAFWTAVVANNGVGYKPYLVQKVLDPEGRIVKQFEPEKSVEQVASPENMKIVQAGMRETVTDGSATNLADLKVPCAGKTGTSQFDGADLTKTHAWFTAYCPYNDPQIVITVLAEAGGEGHAAAAPIARNMIEWWIEHRYNK